MDLGGWLRSLGLERYEAAFRENEIDETVLPSLTHKTLKELGVAEKGDRRIKSDGSSECTSPATARDRSRPDQRSESASCQIGDIVVPSRGENS